MTFTGKKEQIINSYIKNKNYASNSRYFASKISYFYNIFIKETINYNWIIIAQLLIQVFISYFDQLFFMNIYLH